MSKSKKSSINDFVDKDLKNFKIVEMTEVFHTNDDGRYTSSCGFFKSQNVAEAFIKTQINEAWHNAEQLFVLTDGKVGFVIESEKLVKFFKDKDEIKKIRKKILEKLDPGEQEILGL